MELLKRFEQYIRAEKLCDPSQNRILLAVSGGKDSMLMMYLFVQAGYKVGVAHCNFGLRGQESDLDEALVLDYAKRWEIPVFVRLFDTTAYAGAGGISIQMAARDLRYEWFETLSGQLGYDRIAVAHHATDQVETILINQLRGTGIRGMQGMLPRRGRIIRPLLFLTAEEIGAAVRDYGLEYRDDLSNFSTDYLRNRVRLEILPLLREIHAGLEETFARNAAAAREIRGFLDGEIAGYRRRWVSTRGEAAVLQLGELRKHPGLQLLLYELLHPYGFTAAVCRDISRALQPPGQGALSPEPDRTQAGQQFYSATHVLLIDRDEAWIREQTERQQQTTTGLSSHSLIDRENRIIAWDSHHIEARFSPVSDFDRNIFGSAASKNQAYFDADEIKFPLRVRKWREGDRFRPYGMSGRQKKISDLFRSLKIALWQKEQIPVVEDAEGTILWIAPYRQSWDYNICDKTMNVMTLSYFCKNGG